MIAQTVVTTQIVSDGQTYKVRLIENPTIDDVLGVEAKIYAFSMAVGNIDDTRRVGRDVRDFLIRIGVTL
jgi:hypothetical protein